VASVRSGCLASRRALMARLRRAAMTLGPDRVLTGFVLLVEGVAQLLPGVALLSCDVAPEHCGESFCNTSWQVWR
jgi:hypothetical protein